MRALLVEDLIENFCRYVPQILEEKKQFFFAQLRLGSVMVLQEVFVLGWIRVEEQVILKVFRRAALRLDVVAGQLDDAEDGGGELPGAGDVGGVVLGVVRAGDLAHLADHQVPVGASANPALLREFKVAVRVVWGVFSWRRVKR